MQNCKNMVLNATIGARFSWASHGVVRRIPQMENLHQSTDYCAAADGRHTCTPGHMNLVMCASSVGFSDAQVLRLTGAYNAGSGV